MLLAEKDLPNSPNAGNELFDKLGALGLTFFMQEVARARALEGELVRTIQLTRGAARVHIAMADEGSFRPASAAFGVWRKCAAERTRAIPRPSQRRPNRS